MVDENVQEMRFISAAPPGVYSDISISMPRSLRSASYGVSIDGRPIESSATGTSVSFAANSPGRSLVAGKLN